jgi:heterogeneous nuclear ribonucleoprotein L
MMPEYHGEPPQAGMGHQGCVLMFYGSAQFNCQKLFNLLCLYGHVVRIKFLKSKEGAAMVQMGDPASCDRAMQNLNGSAVFGSPISLSLSKQAFIQDVTHPINLQDGSLSFIDFMGNRNNRFTTPEAAAKNRIQPVSKVLYFFNVPSNATEDDLMKIFIDADVKPPYKIKIFPSRNEKSCTGIMEWEDKSDCIEALVTCNHTILPNPNGKIPFIIKFSFSGPQKSRGGGYNE